MQRAALLAVILAASSLALADDGITRTDNAKVTYSGIDKVYAKAIARTVTAARAVAAEQFGFDMPETVFVSVRCERSAAVRLYNGGSDSMFLTLRSERNLRKPSESGIFNLYGLCHEIAHLAMYRLIRDHGWMTTAAAKGWAHYLGSRIVDEVHAREGEGLWPDAYDYLADGTRRLERELGEEKPSPVTRGAGLWKELTGIVGDKKIAGIFKVWGKAKPDPADPAAVLRKTLLKAHKDERLSDWWDKAEPVLIFKRPKSGFALRTAGRGELSGRADVLIDHDGTPASRRSFAGGGHAVRCSVRGDGWYLTGVAIYGSRYGYPRGNFHVWLCDKDFKTIADFPFPYSKFKRGNPGWVALPVKPTNVPPDFIVCVGFNPTRTKGVFVHHDKEGGGNSLVGLPGKGTREFREGDWLIRVSVDQLKAASPLKPGK